MIIDGVDRGRVAYENHPESEDYGWTLLDWRQKDIWNYIYDSVVEDYKSKELEKCHN